MEQSPAGTSPHSEQLHQILKSLSMDSDVGCGHITRDPRKMVVFSGDRTQGTTPQTVILSKKVAMDDNIIAAANHFNDPSKCLQLWYSHEASCKKVYLPWLIYLPTPLIETLPSPNNAPHGWATNIWLSNFQGALFLALWMAPHHRASQTKQTRLLPPLAALMSILYLQQVLSPGLGPPHDVMVSSNTKTPVHRRGCRASSK
jgi:hypothetical protein